MFIGEYTHSLDVKGRVALPVKFRQKISDGAIITRGLDHSLFVFNKNDWEILAQKILALPMTNANSRAFARLMLSGAAEAEFDAQGRILIPEPLRQYAGLSSGGGSLPTGQAGASGGKRHQVVFAGVYNRIEIWDAESWKSYKSKTEASSDDIAEKLGELGL